MAIMNMPKLWTKEGLLELGELIKQSRGELGRRLGLSKGLSQRDLEDYIEEKTGYRISNSTLSGLERASHQEPNWNTLAIIAAAEFVLKPDGTPYTVEEFSAIASQTYSSKNGHSLTMSGVSPKSDVCHSHSDNVYPKSSRKGTSVMSGNWNDERTCVRVQNLIQASLRKMGLSGQPGTAAERAGINPATFDRAALRAFESGSVSRMLGTTVNAGLESAIASICYEVVGGWDGDTPRSLGNATYMGRPQALLRDLHLNNERQTV